MAMSAPDKESAFAELIRDYENQWVAIIDKDGVEFVMGTGPTAVEAAKEASEKGYPQAMLFKVPSFSSRFVF
jgi:heterodisulfide reductase subunit A-like polyferredoxin